MKNIALLTGGYGPERGISLKSAGYIENEFDVEKFNVFVILVDKDKWYHRESQTLIDRNDFSLNLDGKAVYFDVAFIMIHGDPAENGLIQGYFQSLDIPVTSCNTFVSALTFNKFICNKILAQYGIISAKSVLIRKGDRPNSDIISKLGLPLFVKPNNNGSSYGISKVKNEAELEPAVRKGFEYDDELIIESFIEGREFTCGAAKLDGEIITFPITEIVSHNEYFDFAAKYEEASDEITPADLSEILTASCQEVTKRVYKVLNCAGIIRVDFILKNNMFYLIEVNTIPGMTEQSLIPQQIRAHGWTMKEFLTEMVEEAVSYKH